MRGMKETQGERKLFRMMHTSHISLYYTAGQYTARERWEFRGRGKKHEREKRGIF